MANHRTDSIQPLSERLRRRAETMQPDKRLPIIRRIIEVRIVLAEQRGRGLSWAALADLLGNEGVHVSAGTLRNYMRQIGRAERALLEAGNASPSDAQIHARLHQQGTLIPSVRSRISPQPQRQPGPRASIMAAGQPHSPDIPAARPSLIRNPDREL